MLSTVPMTANPRRGVRIEQLPKWLLCIPLVAQWFWLALRHRSLTLPSAVNPSIETGGMAGESKAGCLGQIGAAFAAWVSPFVLVAPGGDPEAARRRGGLAFPLIAKPDIGWCGYGVRRIDDRAGLDAYAAAFPPDGAFLLQRLETAPHEAGLLYAREADGPGRILAMTLRHGPSVLGDGRRDVATLIEADPRLRGHRDAYRAALLASIPAAGERVMLTTIASLRVGARYEDATALVTPRLAARLDAIAGSMDRFHFGRFDVRFASLARLREGEFRIIEVNGAGAEAIQFWDPALTLGQAFAGVFAKQRQLFALGRAMRARGYRPVGVIGLARAWMQQQRLIRRYPSSM